jgi:hypothetical protein
VAPLLYEVAENLSSIYREHRQRLEVSIEDDRVELFADRARVVQVATNLLSNASKYSPEDTQVDLRMLAGETHLTVEIEDHGIGISHEDQEQLFTEFFRANNQQTRAVPGTGLGLVIARSLIELHGGQMGLESEPGRGTVVRFTLPLDGGPLAGQESAALEPFAEAA